MNILVIFTGGTIGSSVQNGWISPDKSTKSELIYRYNQAEKFSDVHFSSVSPYTVLSENLSVKEINSLICAVIGAQKGNYDGVIITHGTDTLQYSAAVLDFTIEKKLPIVLVSSDYPLADKRSNGLENFRSAVNFIRSKPCGGVFVSYKNRNERLTHIHLATRIIAHLESCADLYSIDGKPYALVDNDTKEVAVCSDKQLNNFDGVGKVQFCAKPNILIVESYPEKTYSYNLDKYSAVIVSPFHSGTLNTASENFQSFCKRAKDKDVPVFVVNVSDGVAYKSSKLFSDLGLIVLPLCTRTAIFVKCWLALSLCKDVKQFVLDKIGNEF